MRGEKLGNEPQNGSMATDTKSTAAPGPGHLQWTGTGLERQEKLTFLLAPLREAASQDCLPA